jgi:type VI protein secretion system component Hcp
VPGTPDSGRMNDERRDEEQIDDLDVSAEESNDVKGGGNDFLLTLDGIKGESQDATHKDNIQISSFRKK